MKTGSEFHVGIVGLGSMGMGAALSCVRAGLSTWGAAVNFFTVTADGFRVGATAGITALTTLALR